MKRFALILAGVMMVVPMVSQAEAGQVAQVSSRSAYIDFSNYAAVAYSPSTGAYGYAWNCDSRGEAEAVALSNCSGGDARIVGWVQGGWLVLAIGENNSYGVGYEYGNGADNAVAGERAMDECTSHGDHVRMVIVLSSGDIDPVIYT